ncbi:MAG: sodium:solute symporter [Bacteroidia bacterium]|nr:sodium:solute symporter [Bacteroidia bacterium]
MNPTLTLALIGGYFGLLFLVSWFTGKNTSEKTFFTADRNSPWYLVAFGMIGASLSGVTFISVPGAVGSGQWAYMQMVIGYLLGYFVIATVLLPLYYRLNLTSIYGYLDQRFGVSSYKSGAILFLISRIIGSSLRLYLVAVVLQLAVFDYFNVPFAVTAFVSIALIYIYTFKGGIKTVVWTDFLQTFFLLAGAGLTVYLIADELNLSFSALVDKVYESPHSQIFFWEWGAANNFFKQFFSGAFIAIVMTGLDQDMMQKNLTCRTLPDSQKNMFWFSITLVLANLLFMSLGVLLYVYGTETGLVREVFDGDCLIQVKDVITGEMVCRKTDQLFPLLSLNYLGPAAGIIFIIGIIAAAYSSADSALTALTTSFCVDILDFEKKQGAWKKRVRNYVHIGFSFVLFLAILVFKVMSNDAVINEIFKLAGYTYGPLLGLFAFGLFTEWKVRDRWVPLVCILSPLLSYVVQSISPAWGYTFGFEILLLNGVLTFAGLMALRKK